tara:strand:+ start:411 stop:1289 length:879 start_codon:yes stop_codon:yes gene_type:complete
MDKVLTRKMFKARYFKSLKPTIKHFQTGGLGSLTPREKAIYASTLAAPLLQAKGSGVGNALSALGEGIGKLPATIISVEKMKAEKSKSKSVRALTSAEKKEMGYNVKDRVIGKVENGYVTDIVDKPTFAERKDTAKRENVVKKADTIAALVKSGDVSTGPLGGGRMSKITAAIGINPKAAELDARIEDFRKEAIAALRGAQVGPLEEASFAAILPSILDDEGVILKKLQVAKENLQTLNARIGSGGTVQDPDNISGYKDAFAEFGITFKDVQSYDPSLKSYEFSGEDLVEIK